MSIEKFSPHPYEEEKKSIISVDPSDFRIEKDESLSTEYTVSVLRQHFGKFVTNSKGSACLTWRGNVDFQTIDKSISDLSKIILDKEIDYSNPELRFGVVFNSYDSKEPKYNLLDRVDYESYMDRLDKNDSVSDLRYSVNDDDRKFVLHVRGMPDPNKIFLNKPKAGVNVVIPTGFGLILPQKSEFFSSEGLAEWVMQHHWSGKSYESRGVKPQNIFSGIKKVTS